MKNYKKILCISSTGMGNSILYIPVLRSLKREFPSAKIDVIVSGSGHTTIIEMQSAAIRQAID